MNEYKIGKRLGTGTYSKVKLAINKESGQKFAIKILKKSFLKSKREFIKEEEGSS